MKEKKKENYSRMGLILYFLQGSKRWFALAVFFALFMQLLSLVNPKIIAFTVDSVIGSEEVNTIKPIAALIEKIGGIGVLKEHIWIIAAAVILVAICDASVMYLFRICNARGAEILVKSMRDKLFSHIQHLSYSWYSENMTGDIIQRCTSDVETIKTFLSDQLAALIRIGIMILMAVYFMMTIHVRMALISAAFIPIIILYSFFFHSRIGSTFQKADEEEGVLSTIAQENLSGVRVVRAFGREAYEKERFEKQNSYYTKMWIRLMRYLSAFWSTGDLISCLQVLAVTALGAYYCVNGQMTSGNYIAFVSYNAILSMPVRSLGRIIAQLSQAGVSIDRLAYIMNSKTEEEKKTFQPASVCKQKPAMDQDICFEHVSYQYENSASKVLDDLSFEIKAGETLGILGETGSGKSSLMYLLDRLYDLSEENGKITIGGLDIRQIDRSYLRENIGMVLQEPFLFSGSIAENIKIARPDASMQDIEEAARKASLDETISKFENGYETYVGERGVTLSGGQKQRTAIAQMLIRKPKIMIFDDSLSAVDAETDLKIRRAIAEEGEKATVILIAHRVTTLLDADHIILLKDGKILEEGSPSQLLEKNGSFTRIYQLQMEGSEYES